MGTQGAARKRSTKKDRSTAEDDALNLIAREAEARLAAKRAARAEAREIRMKELERQQKELSDDDERMSVGSRGSVKVDDRDYLEKGSRSASALTAATLTSIGGTSSRRGSGETAITVDAESAIREIKEIHELKDQIQDVETKYMQNLKEVKDALTQSEEKYRKAMVSNAQLDNEKNDLMYQVDTLKDSLMELEELLSESRREYEEKAKDFEREKHAHSVLQFQFNEMKETLKQSEELLNEIRQLRLKQDGFVREVSDLQETVEWKDKKIGALERQKEYTDAIRIERDELREEVVKLKDILKKHGIVLGPDLNVNGDVGEAEADGSSTEQPASQPAQETQSSPAEGNSMLGNTEETELRRSKEGEVNPEQQQEILEEAKDNHSNSDTVCQVADVFTLGTSEKEQLPEEQQTHLPVEEEENSLNKDLTIDVVDCPATETKVTTICSPEIQVIVTSPEENVPKREMFEGGDLKETSDTNSEKTDTKSSVDTHSRDIRETSNDLSEEHDNKREDVQESDLINTESCHQQKITHVTTEFLLDESASAISNNEPQQEPENPEEAENKEVEDTASNSTKGKKKKKKKKGKKKGAAHNDTKEQEKENGKTEKDVNSEEKDNVATDESNIKAFKESKVDEGMNEEDKQEAKVVDAVELVEVTDSFSQQESREEPRVNHDDEPPLKIMTLHEVGFPPESLSPTQMTPSEEASLDEVVDKQNVEVITEILTAESVETVKPIESCSHDETQTKTRAGSKKEGMDEEQSRKAEAMDKMEAVTSSEQVVNPCTYDINSNAFSVDDSDTRDLSDCSEAVCTEPELIVQVEDQIQSVDEMTSDCATHFDLEMSSKEISDVPNRSNVPADDSTSISESKDQTTDGFICGFESSSQPEPLAAVNSCGDDPFFDVLDQASEEESEAVTDDGKPIAEPEQECSPPSVADPSQDLSPSGLMQDAAGREELKEEKSKLEDSGEPQSSSHGEKRPSITTKLEPFDTEAVVQDEQLQDIEGKTEEHEDWVKESSAEVETENASQSPEEATDINSFTEQETVTAQDSGHEKVQQDEDGGPSVCLLTEQLHDSTEDKSENIRSSKPTQQDSHEEDDEDEEGQSFEFDDMDVEEAMVSDLLKNGEEKEVEEGVTSVESNSSAGRCQVDPPSNENAQDKPVESSECTVDGCYQVEANTVPQEAQEEAASRSMRDVCKETSVADEPKHSEEEKGFSVGELGAVVQNITQTVSSLVEEALDVVKLEWQEEGPASPSSAGQVASSSKETQQAGKKGRKGKGKGKEDCKMS